MLTDLGEHLKVAREKQGSSLQVVAGEAKISAAYLQKLERGEVDTPSPRVLRRLAAALEVPYLHLMLLAGYLNESEMAEADSRTAAPVPHPLAGRQLTPEEWHAVGAFIVTLVDMRDGTVRPDRIEAS